MIPEYTRWQDLVKTGEAAIVCTDPLQVVILGDIGRPVDCWVLMPNGTIRRYGANGLPGWTAEVEASAAIDEAGSRANEFASYASFLERDLARAQELPEGTPK